MRLFGNMYAGELVFMLIALMGGAMAASPERQPGSSSTVARAAGPGRARTARSGPPTAARGRRPMTASSRQSCRLTCTELSR
jgi:hypothetical protein